VKTENPIAYIVFGIVFSFIGFKFIWKRTTIVDAYMASTKAFWEKFGYIPNKRGKPPALPVDSQSLTVPGVH
jgi:hypothetical protein